MSRTAHSRQIPEIPLAFGEGEVECSACGLDPVCQVLDYGADAGGVVAEILKRRRAIPNGVRLFDNDQPLQSIFAVKSGSFKAVSQDAQGRQRVVGFYLPGELIGTDAMAGRRYTTSVLALEPSQVCDLWLSRLEASGRPLESLQRAIIEMLGREVAFHQQLISSLIKQNSEQRLAAFLLSLSQRLRVRGLPAESFRLSMSRSDIASYLGLARETVSRLLTRLQGDGLIRLRGKRLVLLDLRGLERLAASI